MKKMLVGVDLNTACDRLLGRAADLARVVGGRVDLLYVADRESAAEQAARRESLEKLLARLDEEHQGVASVLEGEPYAVLRERSTDCDLLVVGPREPAIWRRLLEDAMAVRVIAGAHCPVFVPRSAEPEAPLRRILVGLNLRRDDAEGRLKEAGEWASVMSATLDAVFCEMNPARYAYDVSPSYEVEQRWLAGREDDERRVGALLGEKVPPGARGKAFLLEDEPARGLVELSGDYDLVVVGSADVAHPSILLGSVAVDVVRHARCDVLTLPV